MSVPDFSLIFHHASNDAFRNLNPVQNDPDEWSTFYYKSYPRLPKIDLPRPELPAKDLFQAIGKRRSEREFSRLPLTTRNLSALLKYSVGIVGESAGKNIFRAYPSAGSRFSIETYVFMLQENGEVSEGLYHYDVKHHQLSLLLPQQFSKDDVKGLFREPWAENASAVFVFTSTFWRTQNKYGMRGYRYIFLESGHIGQNIYLVSQALDLKCCALGTMRDEAIEELLDIDGVTESVVYAIAVGK